MDLPKKYSSRYVTIIYTLFIILFAFTVSLFYLSRCQKPPRLTNQDDSALSSKDSSEHLKTEPNQIFNGKDQSQDKIEPLKSNNETDATLDVQPSEKVSSSAKNSTTDDLKTSPGETSILSVTSVRPGSAPNSSGQKVVIYFSTDSTGLTDDALGTLKMIHEFLLKHPDEQLIIEGYGDSGENNQINEKLSQFRAEIVKSYFVKKGISSSRIKVFWMGVKKPAGEDDPQGKEDKNHQVEIWFKSRSKIDIEK